MNTIIVSMDSINTERYKGRSSQLPFEEFNLILYMDNIKLHIEIKDTNPHGVLIKVENDPWIGLIKTKTIEEIYPDEESMIAGEFEDGDYQIGEFLIPIQLLSEEEVTNIIDLLATEEGYSHYSKLCKAVCGVVVAIMMMGEEKRKRITKTVNPSEKFVAAKMQKVKKTDNKIFLLDDIVNYVSLNYTPSKEHHEIQCPCWEVRGHYRHYKSGKTIFIPSHRKGKQKDTAEPKTKVYIAGEKE